MFAPHQRFISIPTSSDTGAYSASDAGINSERGTGSGSTSSGGSKGGDSSGGSGDSSSVDNSTITSGGGTGSTGGGGDEDGSEPDSCASMYPFESRNQLGGGGGSSISIDCRRIASTLKSANLTDLDGDDPKILDILENYLPILMGSVARDPACIVATLRDYLADDCPLVGSPKLWGSIGAAAFILMNSTVAGSFDTPAGSPGGESAEALGPSHPGDLGLFTGQRSSSTQDVFASRTFRPDLASFLLFDSAR